MADDAKKTSFFSSNAVKKFNSKALLKLVLLVACCAVSFYFYDRMIALADEQNQSLMQAEPIPDAESIREVKDLEELGASYTNMSKVVSMTTQSALLASTSASYPISTPTEMLVAVGISAASPSPDEGVPDQEYELDPPDVSVVATMITADGRIAMINVHGEDTALVVHEGSSFSGGTAKITKIEEKGVTFTWMGNIYSATM